MSDNLVKIRQQAEKAVEGMKNGSLKEKAFETILAHLLASNDAGITARSAHGVPKARTPAARTRPTLPTSKTKAGPMARVEALVAEGFFKKSQTIGDVRTALRNQGHSYPNTTLSPVLVRLTRKRVLRRTLEKQAGKKSSFTYSNW